MSNVRACSALPENDFALNALGRAQVNLSGSMGEDHLRGFDDPLGSGNITLPSGLRGKSIHDGPG